MRVEVADGGGQSRGVLFGVMRLFGFPAEDHLFLLLLAVMMALEIYDLS